MKAFAIPDLNPAFIARNRAALGLVAHPKTTHPTGILAPARPVPVRPRLRQNQGDGMNKTERAFLGYLQAAFDPKLATIHREVSLPLANGCRYKLDFLVGDRVVPSQGCLTVHGFEVKGFARDDAIVKLTVAARVYPWITFTLVSKRKGGGWDFEGVLG